MQTIFFLFVGKLFESVSTLTVVLKSLFLVRISATGC